MLRESIFIAIQSESSSQREQQQVECHRPRAEVKPRRNALKIKGESMLGHKC
jgi:hypothetical protein